MSPEARADLLSSKIGESEFESTKPRTWPGSGTGLFGGYQGQYRSQVMFRPA